MEGERGGGRESCLVPRQTCDFIVNFCAVIHVAMPFHVVAKHLVNSIDEIHIRPCVRIGRALLAC